MQRLYKSTDLAKATGCAKATLNLWVDNGWVKPCRIIGNTPRRPHDRVFTQAEYDRIMAAVRETDGHPRKIFIFLNRSLHETRECTAVTCAELANRCGCCEATVRKALVRLGYPKGRDIAVLEDDIGEVKALVQSFRQEGAKKRAITMSSTSNKPESAGNVTLHIKGLTISLDRKAAEALAEEILEQI